MKQHWNSVRTQAQWRGSKLIGSVDACFETFAGPQWIEIQQIIKNLDDLSKLRDRFVEVIDTTYKLWGAPCVWDDQLDHARMSGVDMQIVKIR